MDRRPVVDEDINVLVAETFDKKKREYQGMFLGINASGKKYDGPGVEEYNGFYKKYRRHFPSTAGELGEALYLAIKEKYDLQDKGKILEAGVRLFSDRQRANEPIAELISGKKQTYREMTVDETKVALNTLEKLLKPHLEEEK